MRGRPPKPRSSELLSGNRGRRESTDDPTPDQVDTTEPPDWLGGLAAEKFRELASMLTKSRVLTVSDVEQLAQYCTVWQRWREAEAKLVELGPVLTTSGGNLVQNPWLWTANKALDQMHKIGTDFGLSPASRTRVKTAGPNPATSPMAALLHRGSDAN